MMDLSVVPYVDDTSRASSATGCGNYRECLRNHAAPIGGQAYDGCGEFMPGGEGGTIEALKCAACGCHRNFHRRDRYVVTPRRPLLVPPQPQHPVAAETRAGTKRCRTKFTAEQKEKMQAFAEKVGWRIEKHDDVALQEFCMEVGVKRRVLKVWIHNNKNHLSSAPATAPHKHNNNAATAAAGPAPITV